MVRIAEKSGCQSVAEFLVKEWGESHDASHTTPQRRRTRTVQRQRPRVSYTETHDEDDDAEYGVSRRRSTRLQTKLLKKAPFRLFVDYLEIDHRIETDDDDQENSDDASDVDGNNSEEETLDLAVVSGGEEEIDHEEHDEKVVGTDESDVPELKLPSDDENGFKQESKEAQKSFTTPPGLPPDVSANKEEMEV